MTEWFNAGRISPVPSGTWNDTTEYKRLDIVTDPNMQRSYIAKKDVPAGTPLTDGDCWQLLVETFHAVSLKTAADRLASPFSETGDIVTCHPVEDYPLGVVTHIEPVQEGSGDPSPDNIRPITGHAGDVLMRCGKNLLNPDNYDSMEGSVLPGNCVGKTLYFSVYSESGTSQFNGCVNFADGTRKNFVIMNVDAANGTWYTYSYTIPQAAISCGVYNVTASTKRTGIKAMISFEDTEYEPYNAETYTADFGQTVYGGTLDWNTGVLTVDRGYRAFDGSENWAGAGSAFTNCLAFNVTVSDCVFNNNMWTEKASSHMKTMTANEYSADNNINGVGGYGRVVTIKLSRTLLGNAAGTNAEHVDDFKTYLAAQHATGTPVQICYKLETPITIQLTPQDILALGGVNTLYAEAGDITVSGRISPIWMNEQLKSAIIALGGNI